MRLIYCHASLRGIFSLTDTPYNSYRGLLCFLSSEKVRNNGQSALANKQWTRQAGVSAVSAAGLLPENRWARIVTEKASRHRPVRLIALSIVDHPTHVGMGKTEVGIQSCGALV
jgi:hypothetical protein